MLRKPPRFEPAARSGTPWRRRRLDCSQMRPPCACTIEAQIDRPRPSPSFLDEVSGSNSGQLRRDAAAVVGHADLDCRPVAAPTGADADAAVGAARLDDGLDGIVHEVEDHLLELDAVAEDRRQRIGDVELDGDPLGCGVRPGEHQRILQRPSSTSSVLKCGWPRRRNSRMRRTTPPAWSICATRVVRLPSARCVSASGARRISWTAARQRARRRHRLIDLVRQGRRHAAHQVHARGPPRLAPASP